MYAIIWALLMMLAGVYGLHERERQTWTDERQRLLDRIQAPEAVLSRVLQPPDESATLTDEARLRRKAEAMGLSLDDLRVPPGWG